MHNLARLILCSVPPTSFIIHQQKTSFQKVQIIETENTQDNKRKGLNLKTGSKPQQSQKNLGKEECFFLSLQSRFTYYPLLALKCKQITYLIYCV